MPQQVVYQPHRNAGVGATMSERARTVVAEEVARAAAVAPQAQVEAQMLDGDDGFEQLLDFEQEDGGTNGGTNGVVACQSSLACPCPDCSALWDQSEEDD